MAVATHHETTHTEEPSFLSLLSGWAQQGAQTFFSTQRILLDVAMRQNANVMHVLRQQLADPVHSPTTLVSEAAGEGMENFLAGQKVLLELGKQQNEILMSGLKERVGDCPRRHAAINMLRRSVDTFLGMQEEFLKLAGKQNRIWVEAAKARKPYQPEHLVDLAREGMENFVKAQKRFLDVISEETTKAVSGKAAEGAKKTKKTEIAEIARQATESFIDAQKKLFDVASQQATANVNNAGKVLEMIPPLPFLPFGNLAKEAVRSYIEAQRALMDAIMHPTNGREAAVRAKPRVKRPARASRKTAAVAAA